MVMNAKVPEEMIEAVLEEQCDRWGYETEEGRRHVKESQRERAYRDLEVAIKWIIAHPIVPTAEQCDEMIAIGQDTANTVSVARLCQEWQRRMFLAPVEPELKSFDTPLGKFVIDSRVPPGEIRINSWNGPIFMKNVCLCTTAVPDNKLCPIHGPKK